MNYRTPYKMSSAQKREAWIKKTTTFFYKKRFSVAFFLVGFSLAWVIAFFFFQRTIDPALDISMQPPSVIKRAIPGKVWLISYADNKGQLSNGATGSYVNTANQNFQTFSALNKGIDAIIHYSRRDIDPLFYKKNKTLLDIPLGGGLWLWKPYIIHKALKMIPEGDVLIYLDVGVSINKNITPLVNHLKHYDIILFKHPNEATMLTETKREALIAMGFDTPFYHKHIPPASGVIVIKNTSYARDFIGKWLYHAQDPRLIDQKNYSGISEHKEFMGFHHADQSVLSLVLLKEKYTRTFKENPRILEHEWVGNPDSPIYSCDYHNDLKNFYGYFFLHRRRTLKESLFNTTEPSAPPPEIIKQIMQRYASTRSKVPNTPLAH